MKKTFRRGDVSVELDLPDLEAAWVPTFSEVIEEEIRQRLEKVYLDAREKWPVRTGKSRAGLRMEVGVSRDEIVGELYNEEQYAYKISFKSSILLARRQGARSMAELVALGPLRGAHVWSALVRSPGREAGKDLEQHLATALAAALDK